MSGVWHFFVSTYKIYLLKLGRMSRKTMNDKSFEFNEAGLKTAVDLLGEFLNPTKTFSFDLPVSLPENGMGEIDSLTQLAPLVIGGAAPLGAENAQAHMDPPTPWIAWASAMWNASLNQNLLHPATSPTAKMIEERVIQWLCPFFGMSGGQVVPGSTLANITALWAARETRNATRVVASIQSHISIRKAAHLLGMEYVAVETDTHHRLNTDLLGDLSNSVLVLTAGTTSTGAIDSLIHQRPAAWVHVDAAWAGPLMLSKHHKDKLAGITHADSVSISAHKWLFQPKESALILFKNWENISPSLSFGGAYLAAPNIGILGSHGATAVPLLATLLAWGRSGIADRIERCMAHADELTGYIKNDARFTLFCEPESGVVVWKPVKIDVDNKLPALKGIVSSTRINDHTWFRSVAANPNSDVQKIFQTVCQSLFNS